MNLTTPPADTAAHQAMTDQGKELYPGVDQWQHPEKGLPAGKILVQFDYRDADVIKQSTNTASVYFTDAETLMKYLNEKGEVQARGLAEALQVGPYRENLESPHLYSQNVALYQLQRELKAEQVQVAQPAEFSEGLTRNNLHWGEGVGKQFFVAIPRDQLRTGEHPLLKLSTIMPCTDTQHRLGWLQELERQQQPKEVVIEAVARVFESRVEQLQKGPPQQQEHGKEIAALLQVRRSFDAQAIEPATLKKQTTPPAPAVLPPNNPAPQQRRRGPRF